MRIESALFVKRVKTKGEFNGDIWLGFERLTCVPIQTRMVKENLLSKEEKQWIKVCRSVRSCALPSFLTSSVCSRTITNDVERSSSRTCGKIRLH